MNQRTTIHSYSELPAFERLMLLIATFLKYPGVGYINLSEEDSGKHHNALHEVLVCLQDVAEEFGINLPLYSEHTIRKDLKTLRCYGVLSQSTYRWGYYLGTGVMSWRELRVALNALYSQAKHQEDPQINRIYEKLTQRLRGLSQKDGIFYPVRTQLDRVIIRTDYEERIIQGNHQDTLFEKLDLLESAILKGQVIELFRKRNPYRSEKTGSIQVYPLQIIYADIAWYLLHEDYQGGCLAVSRLDRFDDHFQILKVKERSLDVQRKSLEIAHELLRAGWGLKLGSSEEQQRELRGELEPIEVRVRFFPEVMAFIQEGEKRHPKQEIKPGPKGKDGKPAYVDYIVRLPERSLEEFCRWVHRFMGNAQFIYPQRLADKHQQAARILLERYATESA